MLWQSLCWATKTLKMKMVECRQVNPYFGTKCPLGWEWFWVSRVLICCKKAKLDITKRTWRVGITRSAARAGTPNRMNLLYPAPITVTYSQTEMDLESRWCMVSKQKGFLFLCARGFDAMLRTSYILLTNISQRQFCLTITGLSANVLTLHLISFVIF